MTGPTWYPPKTTRVLSTLAMTTSDLRWAIDVTGDQRPEIIVGTDLTDGWKHGRYQTRAKIFTIGWKHGRFQTLRKNDVSNWSTLASFRQT